jgi:hypothetical protein
MKMQNRWHVPALALLLAVGGCSGSGLLKVTGKVTYKGQPVPSMHVAFQPEEVGKRVGHGFTDDQGNFTLTASRTEKGIPAGHYVAVVEYHATSEEGMGTAPPHASKELKAILAKYGDPKKSPLHYEVTKNGDYFEIELK